MVQKVQSQCQQHGNHDQLTYILAVSMGVDSAVLLEIFNQLPYSFHVVHFNHHKRQESQAEAAYLQSYCDQRGIPCTIFDVPKMEGNFQKHARTFRYQQLEMVAQNYQRSIITTAHHLDDQVETYIQRIFGGSSIAHRTGMRSDEKRGERIYFRPLLDVEKASLYESAEEGGVMYFEDHSNQENDYQRNQIRNEVVPSIHNCFPAYRQAVQNDLAETVLLSSYLETQYAIFEHKNIKYKQKTISIKCAEFLKEHEFFQKFIIEKCVKRFEVSLKRSRYDEIVRWIYRKQSSVMLKKGLYLHVLNDHIMIGESIAQKYEGEGYCFFLKEGFLKLPKPYNMWYNNENNGSDDFFEMKQEDLPFLKVRSSKHGDEIRIGNHHKRVSRLFIDKKVPQFKRSSYPIVEDIRTSQIVWIPMLYKLYTREKTEKMIQVYFLDGGFHA